MGKPRTPAARGDQPPIPYVGVQATRALRRFDPQLDFQAAATRLVLVQRFVAAPGEGQVAHAAPVRLFEPGLDAQLQAGRGDGLLVVAEPLEVRGLFVEDVERQPVVVLLPVQHPGLKRLAVGHRQTGQEIGAERFGQEQAVPSGRADEGFELGHVEGVVAGRVELYVGGGHEQEMRRLVVTQHLPQAKERLAEVFAGNDVRAVGPEQAGHGFPAVRAV